MQSDAENKVMFDLDLKNCSDAGDAYGMIPLDKENTDDSVMDTSMNTSTSRKCVRAIGWKLMTLGISHIRDSSPTEHPSSLLVRHAKPY